MKSYRLGSFICLLLLVSLLPGSVVTAQLSRLRFTPINPCRVVDTRYSNMQPGALTSGIERAFQVRQFSNCASIPSSARAVSYNATIVNPPAFGHLTLFPSDTAPPNTSSLNFPAGQTTANGGIIRLNTAAILDLKALLVLSSGSGQAHFILDVTGYFQ